MMRKFKEYTQKIGAHTNTICAPNKMVMDLQEYF